MGGRDSDKKILISSYCYWNHPSTRIGEHHFAKYFANEGWRIFWISNPISPFHILREGNRHRFQNWLRGVQEEGGLSYYIPFTLLPCHYLFPFHYDWVGKNSLRFSIPPIRNVLKESGFLDVDILWIRDLAQYYLIDIVNYRKMVLRLVDDYPAYQTSPRSTITLQNMLIERADYVLITSKNLLKYQIPGKHNFYYIPNGVEVEHFSRKQGMPEEYNMINRPRILYVGAIASWFDCELMDYVMKKMPEYNFILIGSLGTNLNRLNQNCNCYVLGPRDYSAIPSYMQNADVGIIPFKMDALTESVSPIKMFDYFASGLPVVATRMKEAESLNPPAYFSGSPEEFVENIRKAYMNREKKNEYLAFANENSWKARYDHIKEIMNEE